MMISMSNNLHNSQMQNLAMKPQYLVHAHNVSSIKASVNNVADKVVEVPKDKSLTPELQNSLIDYKQTKVNEFSLNVENTTQKEKDITIAEIYIEKQKAVANAYTISANGEAVYDTDKEESLSLSKAYVNFYNNLLQSEAELLTGDYSEKLNGSLSQRPSIQALNAQTAGQGTSQTQSGVISGLTLTNKIQQYLSILQPVDHSILFLRA
jgi:hypothetical protein